MARQIGGLAAAGKDRRKPRFLAFWSDRKGASFIEFAIIALPLFLLFFGIIEVGLILWGGLDLENATMDAARLIRTGQAQSGQQYASAALLKAKICSEVVILSNCSSKLQVNIQTFPGGFSTMTLPKPLNSQGNFVGTFNGDPTQVGAGQNVLVTTYYAWPLIDPLTVAALANMAGGNFLLQSAAAFRSEPF